jgi:hypothetical protein
MMITWLPDYLITWLPDYLITWLPDYLITWLPDYLITWLPDYPAKRREAASLVMVFIFSELCWFFVNLICNVRLL